MYTFQDFDKDRGTSIYRALNNAITNHLNSDIYETAKTADEYDHQRNSTIMKP